MKVLVLGGSGFVGRAIAEEAVARGDEVTALNRGLREPVPGVTTLVGDRRTPDGLAALGAGGWDVVIDTWSAEPYVVRESARALTGRTGQYTYISSRSVYAWPPPADVDEDADLVEGSPDAGADGAPVEYGPAKRGGEMAAEATFGERALFVRAGLILGPYEDVGRLPWWLNRIARGGKVVAPGPRELPLQYIDVRDLAVWTLDASAAGLGGAYNVVSPCGHATMDGLLSCCVEATGSTAELCWIGPKKLLAAGVEPWTDLPIWLPPGESHDGMHQGNVSKALAAGLRCRPVGETVLDTWAWLRSIDEAPRRADRPGVGLDPDVEARLLAEYGSVG